MTYTKMDPTARQEVAFPPLSTGMDSRASERLTGDYTHTVLHNLWWREGGLSTRPSVVSKGDFERHAAVPTFLFAEEGTSESWWVESYTQSGTPYMLAFRLNEQGQKNGQMPSLAASYGVITPWQGGYLAIADTGLFFLGSLSGSWQDYSDHLYIPTVMRGIRGRLPAEVEPSLGDSGEEYNTLTDRFKVTFTTDGSSSRFFLPVAGLKNSEVEATLLQDNGRLSTFRVAAGETDSSMQGDCFMRVNRVGGFLQFLGADGLPMPPGTDGREENLVVTAEKAGVAGPSPLKGIRQGQWIKGDSRHARLLLTGDFSDPSRLCWLTPGEELYLPASQVVHVGDEHSPITAMAPLRDRVLLFKSRSVYLLTAGNTAGSLTVTLYPSGNGCVSPQSVCTGADGAFWLDDEGRVRSLYGKDLASRHSPGMVSAPIAEDLGRLTPFSREQASAVWWQERYLLRFDRDIWVMDPTPEHPSWSHWTLPEELSVSAWRAVGSRLELICRLVEDNTLKLKVYHLIEDGAGQDRLWLEDNLVERTVPFGFTTKQWGADGSGHRFRTESVRLRGENDHPLTLLVCTEAGPLDRLRLTPAGMKQESFPLRMPPCPTVGLDLTGEGWLRLRDITFYQRMLGSDRRRGGGMT